MTSDLVKRLRDASRFAQWACPKCEKGFENHEYHCWGLETKGCLASWEELCRTVRQWKKERAEAAARIEALEAALKTCADKLEKCALAGGSDKWAVDELVKPFRAAALVGGENE